ncbi:MAG: DUF1801 domain-containing protein [Actinomycetota bacterium]
MSERTRDELQRPAEPVADTFAAIPNPVRTDLLRLRDLILEVAEETAGVGPLEETLKWGQPSYLTSESGSGTTIRIAPTRPEDPHDYGLYVHCQTDVIPRVRDLFGDTLDYDGNRGLLFRAEQELPVDELRQCIVLALTYHRRDRR